MRSSASWGLEPCRRIKAYRGDQYTEHKVARASLAVAPFFSRAANTTVQCVV